MEDVAGSLDLRPELRIEDARLVQIAVRKIVELGDSPDAVGRGNRNDRAVLKTSDRGGWNILAQRPVVRIDERKGADLLVVNAVGAGRAFGQPDNAGVILGSDGSQVVVEQGPKALLAAAVCDSITARLNR